MTAARTQFEGFVTWLRETHQADAYPDAICLLNIVLSHFNEVASRGPQNSRRSAYLRDVWRAQYTTLNPELPPPAEAFGDAAAGWSRLKSLEVGPFRGFRYSEPLSFPKRITLVSGANGTGKTSFCQALEYGLLGYVQEAELCRLEPHEYLRNAFENRFEAPQLVASDWLEDDVAVQPNPALFNFAFIEKNRIESFARMATKTPRAKEDQIASLFGIDPLIDFLSGFNASVDPVCKLEAKQTARLRALERSIETDTVLIARETEIEQGIAGAYAAISEAYSPGLTHRGLLDLIGTPDQPGRIAELEDVTSRPRPELCDVSIEELRHDLQELRTAYNDHQSTTHSLTDQRQNVSYRDLYQAVVDLRSANPESCPACETPLRNSTSDPYSKAEAGLARLSALAELEGRRDQLFEAVEYFASELTSNVRRIVEFETPHPDEAPVSAFLDDTEADPTAALWAGIEAAPEGAVPTIWAQIESLAARALTSDNAKKAALAELNAQRIELQRLQAAREQVGHQDGIAMERRRTIQQSRQRVAAFQNENINLIASAEAEQRDIAVDLRLSVAYDRLTALMGEYRAALPGRLMAGLQELTLALYNDFNRDDADGDRLTLLRLPIDAEGRIILSFNSTPTIARDALHVLSEGHIRCLGLSILLAKNLHSECPIVVFDDAVNAIDSDHRAGILETIFGEANRFGGKQIFVTCHNPEFLTQVQQRMPGDASEHSDYLTFIGHAGDNHPRIRVSGSRKYLDAARTQLEEGNPRACLSNCRFAVEDLGYLLWRWLGREGFKLRFTLLTPSSEPFLREIIDQARSCISQRSFAVANKAELVRLLELLLEQAERGLLWDYLNGGVHPEEYGADFDRSVVRAVLNTVSALETAYINRNQQPIASDGHTG